MSIPSLRLPVLFVTVLGLVAGCGGGEEVARTRPRLGSIEESFVEPAKTRLARIYTITQPLDGRIGRIDLEPGDPVTAGQELVAFDRVPWQESVNEAEAMVAELEASIRLAEYDEIENLVKREAQTTIEVGSEVLKTSHGQVTAQRARYDRAVKELERKKKLVAGVNVFQSEVDDAQLEVDTSLIDLRGKEFTVAAHELLFTILQLGPTYVDKWLTRKAMQRGELEQRLAQARARLAVARHDLSLAKVTSPIDGIVLARQQSGDTALAAGTPLLLLGNLSQLEVVVEVLTEEALRLQPGTVVALESNAFDSPVQCRVTRIEPAGFTKLSSLGIEQQRVRVIVKMDEIPPGLGVGYRVRARFVTGRNDNALIVPRTSVLQGKDGGHFVFVVDGDRLQRREVKVGLKADLEVEITEGLEATETIVLAPDAMMQDGDRVAGGE